MNADRKEQRIEKLGGAPLQERLRVWFNARLEDKENQRGELTSFGRTVGWRVDQVRAYLRGERHLSFDQVILAVKKYDLDIHRVMNEAVPLPAADYDTRLLLDAWMQLEPGHKGRDAVLSALVVFVQSPRLFRRLRKLPPSESTQPGKPQANEGKGRKKGGGGGSAA